MRFIKSRWTRSTPPTHGFESDRAEHKRELGRLREQERLQQLTAFLAIAGTAQYLDGIVARVEEYGVFVRGPWGQGLVHVSQMSRRFIRDARAVATVGQPARVWVLGVDAEQRVQLSLMPPDRRHAER